MNSYTMHHVATARHDELLAAAELARDRKAAQRVNAKAAGPTLHPWMRVRHALEDLTHAVSRIAHGQPVHG